MAKRLTNPVKIRINRDRLDALYNVCDDMLQQLKPENEHEKLMREYLGELHHMLQKKLQREQHLYTLNMSRTEAIAFRQLWSMLNIQHDKYASIIVRSILTQIDSYNRDKYAYNL